MLTCLGNILKSIIALVKLFKMYVHFRNKQIKILFYFGIFILFQLYNLKKDRRLKTISING